MASQNCSGNNKIYIVNSRFATAILSETVHKLILLYCGEEDSVTQNNENVSADSKPADEDFRKFASDIQNIRSSLNQIINQLQIDNSFTDFSRKSIAEQEYNFLNEYNHNKAMVKGTFSMLKNLEEIIANHRKPTETIDEIVIKCAIRNRFIKTWETARRDQNDHFYRMFVGSAQNELNEFVRKIETENLCIVEIENYSLKEMEMHKEESVLWTEKFDVDINKTEIDIQVSIAELDAMKMNYENTVEAIRFRDQEMKDFVALKIERELNKGSDLMKLIYNHKEHLLGE